MKLPLKDTGIYKSPNQKMPSRETKISKIPTTGICRTSGNCHLTCPGLFGLL